MSTITVLKFDATLEAKRAAIDWASIYPEYLGEPTFHREPNDKLQFLLRTIVLKAGPNRASTFLAVLGDRPSPRPYRGLPDIDYPLHDKTIVVTRCGRICLGRKKINFSQVFGG